MRTASIILISLSMTIARASAELTIWYVRHAEAGHNVKWDYVKRGVPTNEWPVWVGDADAFTPKGMMQAEALATTLPPAGTFDLIAVSPLWRTRNTILPYLKATGQQAEIWPELAETRNFDQSEEDPEAQILPAFLAGSSDLMVEEQEAEWFRLREDPAGRRLYEAWPTTRSEALYFATRVKEMLEERFGEQDATVLLVGHGNTSLTLIRTLTANSAFLDKHLGNTRVWILRGGSDGYRIERYNEPPP